MLNQDMERDLLKLMLNQDMERDLLKLMLNEDMAMVDMVMVDMVMEVMMNIDYIAMAREKLKQSQDILEVMEVMDMAVDMEVMAMDVDTMAKGKQMLNLEFLDH